jgi:hypothetical protein
MTLPPMGMFDDISCEHVLPAEPRPKDDYFQTKDFDRATKLERKVYEQDP